MKIELWWIGKTKAAYLREGIELYSDRLKHYTNFTIRNFDDVKSGSGMNPEILKEKEANMILSKLPDNSLLILLDERGQMMNSIAFSKYLEDHMNYSGKTLIFLIGGAFGFHGSLYAKATQKISFSKMTFSHQMIRLFFAEQLYRAFTIINNEKYHNS